MATKQISFKETDEYKLGHTGELIIANLLQKEGWYIIPSYDYSGEEGNKAPKMQGLTESFVLPDLDRCKDGTREWAEVKTKTEATYTRTTRRLEHGLALRHFNDYKKIQEITGCKVWLFVYENVAGYVLYQLIDKLELNKRIYSGDKMDRGGTIFFPRDSFKSFCQLPPQPHIGTKRPLTKRRLELWATINEMKSGVNIVEWKSLLERFGVLTVKNMMCAQLKEVIRELKRYET